MGEPLVSFIVPVYNVAPWLERCLDSIAAQTWTNLEVWLVDDGSTDGSLALCQARAAADPRFRVLTQANAGVSAARNLALDRATGQYLRFVDGDDYLPAASTREMMDTARATGADLVVGWFWRVSGEHRALRGHIRQARVMTRRDYAGEMLKAPANFYYGVLWNKLYRRSLVEAHRLRCDPEMNWCEDFCFNLEYLRLARLIAAHPQPVYYYVKRGGSLVDTQVTLARTVEVKRITFADYKELYQDLDLYEKQKLRVYGYLLAAARDGSALALPRRPAPVKPGQRPRRRKRQTK